MIRWSDLTIMMVRIFFIFNVGMNTVLLGLKYADLLFILSLTSTVHTVPHTYFTFRIIRFVFHLNV